MNKKFKLIRIFLLLAILLLPGSTALAQSPGEDIVLFGQNYTLESGKTLNGSLAVFGGNATIEEGAKINGDTALFGGNLSIAGDVDGDIALIGGSLTISGTIDGDIVIMGGQALLSESAVIKGDISTIGGNVEKEPGAEVHGEITNNAPPAIDAPEVPDLPNLPNIPNISDTPKADIHPLWDVAGKFAKAVLIGLIGMLLNLFLQPQMERAGTAMVRQPFIAGGYGLIVVVGLPVIAVILSITLILIPIALLMILIAPLAWLFGMVTLGQEVGERFTRALNQTWAPVLSTGLGTFLLVLTTGLIEMIPCLGWLPSFLVSLVVLGGVAMTWFGTRNAPGGLPQPAGVVPPAS